MTSEAQNVGITQINAIFLCRGQKVCRKKITSDLLKFKQIVAYF